MNFKLVSSFKPSGDQPKAIDTLVAGIHAGHKEQTLLGVTGSGKTFAVAKVIAKVRKPALVIAHNKTLAAQLCNEFREFFPHNSVEYFVSYYDYYQPEAYLPSSDTYIEKEAQINEEIDRLRHAATQAILTRRDVIIVASVSCIYGLGSPASYERALMKLFVGQVLTRGDLLRSLVEMQFSRTTADVTRGQFRLRGEVFEIMPVHQEVIYRLDISGQRIGDIEALDPTTRRVRERVEEVWIFPARHYMTSEIEREQAAKTIREELRERLAYFEKKNMPLEVERLSRRTKYDLELIKNVGFCHGIENYSRHFDGRKPGEPPFTLIDYFLYASSDYLLVIDESHVTVPQIRGMYEGDRARKDTLIDHGFRLPSARDNRPLKFDEFEGRMGQTIYTSATPTEWEVKRSAQVVEMVVRPTGLIDPEIIVRPVMEARGAAGEIKVHGQVDDLIPRIKERVERNERVLVTTLTKKMAEDLTDFLQEQKIKVKYLHSDIDTLDRITILTEFRKGAFDVLVGVNLLREGLDLPEVSLVAILDADKEGFLRSETSLIQTIGRAARNVSGQVVLYADELTGSIKRALSVTNRRREIQLAYNKEHGITPKTIQKRIRDLVAEFGIAKPELGAAREKKVRGLLSLDLLGEKGKSAEEIIKEKERQMKEAAHNLEFELAAILRDEIVAMKKMTK